MPAPNLQNAAVPRKDSHLATGKDVGSLRRQRRPKQFGLALKQLWPVGPASGDRPVRYNMWQRSKRGGVDIIP